MILGQLGAVVRDLGAGLIAGLLVVIMGVSVATLVFSGPLAQFQLVGLRMALITTVIVVVVQSLSSGFNAAIAAPQERTAPVLALMAASTATGQESAEQLLILVVTVLVISTLIVGVSLYLIGRFRLGSLIRYFPLPVMGGVLAGTGWLLVLGGMNVMTDGAASLETWPQLRTVPMLERWVPGVVFAVLLLYGRRSGRLWLLPALLVSGGALFYVVMWSMGVTLEEAQQQGWLLGPFRDEFMPLFGPGLLSLPTSTDWQMIVNQLEGISVLVLVAAMSVMLTASALEFETGCDVDVNRELCSAGAANIMSAAAGGIIGFHSVSVSRLSHDLGARGRLASVAVAGVAVLVLTAGVPVLSALPKPLVGGVLLYLGLGFLLDWLWDGRRRLPRSDYLIVVMILAVVGILGFLPGVGLGMLAAVVLFAYQYSRINVIKLALSGNAHHSNVERTPRQKQVLREYGEAIQVLRLQGFLFFGTAYRVYQEILRRCEAQDKLQLCYVILDFEAVSGMDSSVAMSFQKLLQYARQNGMALVWTALSEDLSERLEKSGGGFSEPAVRRFIDVDHGLEWCENKLLKDAYERLTTEHWFKARFQDAELYRFIEAKGVRRFFDVRHLTRGELLVQQGEQADDLYFIENGSVTAWLILPDDRRLRLRTMGAGNVLGEIGWYLNTPRSATVIADRDSVVLSLTRSSLESMEREVPGLAAVFHAHIASLLAERLYDTNQTLRAVL